MEWIIEVCVIIWTITPYNIFLMVEIKLIFSVCLAKIKKPVYFTILLILLLFMGLIALFDTIYES